MHGDTYCSIVCNLQYVTADTTHTGIYTPDLGTLISTTSAMADIDIVKHTPTSITAMAAGCGLG